MTEKEFPQQNLKTERTILCSICYKYHGKIRIELFDEVRAVSIYDRAEGYNPQQGDFLASMCCGANLLIDSYT